MNNLRNLIKEFGEPNALIDHWDSSSNRFAIWGFEEQFIINSHGKAIINGNPSKDHGSRPILTAEQGRIICRNDYKKFDR